jgi:hypothetical protein
MTQQRIKTIYALLWELGLKHAKEDILYGATAGRTVSVRELTEQEYRIVLKYLVIQKEQKVGAENEALRALCHTAVYWFRQLGYYTESGDLDKERINAFVINKMGDKNHRKVGLFQLKKSEVLDLIAILKIIYNKKIDHDKQSPADSAQKEN